jgi:hypothetical protein
LARRRLKLIHSGRLLTGGTLLYGWLASLEERQNRALVLKSSASGTPPNNSGVWLHCSVGLELPEGVDEEDKVQVAYLIRLFDILAL